MRDNIYHRPGNRQDHKKIASIERRERASGKWSPLVKHNMLVGHRDGDPDGWGQDVHTIWKNDWLCIQIRTCRTSMGLVQHAAISTWCGAELTWREKQGIKNNVFGKIATAIEVFPATDRLVDAANMWHLWVLPLDFQLPFGLGDKDPCSSKHYRP